MTSVEWLESKFNEFETIEEAAEKYVPNPMSWTIKQIFIEGSKWQQERSYSEEDLKDAFFEGWIARDGKLTFTKAKNKWFKELKTNKI